MSRDVYPSDSRPVPGIYDRCRYCGQHIPAAKCRLCGGRGWVVVESGDSYVTTKNCQGCNSNGGYIITVTSRNHCTTRFGSGDER